MKRIFVVILFGLSAVLQGCASLHPNPGSISVESDPAGAEVFVMGRNVGVTPLKLSAGDVFPSSYRPDQAALYGTVTLRHAGCEDYNKRVDTDAYSKGIKASLDCGNKPAQAAPATPTAPATPNAEDDGTSSIEARLRRVKELQDKGLITDDEARAARKRILEGL